MPASTIFSKSDQNLCLWPILDGK
uniref:Uncharacterized protein n=1 Tax=Rhizophora mucronata TaxID=61149 RepID=A0A2P2NCA9_RHIMU